MKAILAALGTFVALFFFGADPIWWAIGPVVVGAVVSQLHRRPA